MSEKWDQLGGIGRTWEEMKGIGRLNLILAEYRQNQELREKAGVKACINAVI